MIVIDQLVKTYGRSTVLSIPSLTISSGEVIGLVGNNGAGKTTLFQLILDLIKATQGTVSLKGTPVATDESWKSFTSAYIDDSFLIDFLTADEYFDFVGGLFQKTPSQVKEFTLGFETFFNDEIIGKRKFIRDLSKGNQNKVGLVASLIGNPEIVIWDEPFANLDPSTQIRLKNMVKQHAEGRTFLISSHDISHIADVCTRIIVLEKGTIVRDISNTPETVGALYDYFKVES